jgi:hypothetical protein
MDHPPAGQAAGRRGRNRLRARLAAKIVTLDGTRNTILLDLSQTGARLNASPGMIPGQKAVLTWIGFEAFGSIVWVDNGRCGMVFDEPLSHGVVLATRDVDARDHLPSDHELERWRAREWVAGMRRI